MSTATVTSKGQITIPIDIRTALGIEAGDKVVFDKTKDGIVTVRAKTGSIWDVQGIIPKPKKPISIREMNRVISQMGQDTTGKR